MRVACVMSYSRITHRFFKYIHISDKEKNKEREEETCFPTILIHCD